MPASLITFLNHLLKSSDKHAITRSSNAVRLVNSYASDMIHGVTRGKVIAAKHFLLALGLHSITGQKKPIQICNRLGHCINYDLAMDIETAQAQKAQLLAETSGSLPLKPITSSDVVLTYYWVDNFDVTVEKQAGGGAINTTHLVAFQEPSEFTIKNVETITLERSKTRTIENIDADNTSCVGINYKKEPPSCIINEKSTSNEYLQLVHLKYFLWLWLRKENSFDQVVPNFPGWCLQNRPTDVTLQKTVMTYLPPITTKVTDPTTIMKYIWNTYKTYQCL